MEKDIIPIGQIEKRIYVLRGKRVMLDADLADSTVSRPSA